MSKSIYSEFHYTYRITNIITNKHYYGSRSCKCRPQDDLGIKYYSSSTDEEFIQIQKEHPEIFKYKILSIYKTREEALAKEIILHEKYDVDINPAFYNKAKQTSTSWSAAGKLAAKDINGNIHFISTDDPRLQTKELVHVKSGISASEKNRKVLRELYKDTVIIKGEDGNFERIPTSEYDPNIHKTFTHGKFAVTDGNSVFMVDKNDKRFISGELQSVSKGKVNVINQNGENIRVSVDHPDYLSGKLVNANIGRARTEETKELQSEKRKQYWQNLSEDDLEKRSSAMRGKKNPMYGKTPTNAIPVTVDGILFPSKAAASRYLKSIKK